jgi:NADPH-dependent 2,4-dienoyl-CoA reductase/sulfur reductase-like enzyme/nitrite reductase/ring-hydroxylating ferredoxin subunit
MSDTSAPDLVRDGFDPAAVDVGGMLAGTVDGEDALVVRNEDGLHALGATCTHYGGPLAEGAFDGRTVRCPWHDACFDVRTGQAERAPAFDPVVSYALEERDGRVHVTGPAEHAGVAARQTALREPVVVLGAGAAGFAFVHRLRQRGYAEPVVVLSQDEAAPYDRPNVSKDYLAGGMDPSWMPLRGDGWYEEQGIDLRLGATVAAIDPGRRLLHLEDQSTVEYATLVYAPGAQPLRLDVPGAEHAHLVRTIADADRLAAAVERAGEGGRAVVIGSSFIGLEAAASLAQRGLEVHVVAPEEVPLGGVLGPELGGIVQAIHTEKGEVFHLGRSVAEVDAGGVVLDDGTRLDADVVVFGVGVRPRTALAQTAGLEVDDGVLVDEALRTSDDDVLAIGDVARFPFRGGTARVEHWVHAERQGQAAADILLGVAEAYADVPFFWSAHHGKGIHYSGHARDTSDRAVVGSVEERTLTVFYLEGDEVTALSSLGRDSEHAALEVLLEQGDQEALLAAAGRG